MVESPNHHFPGGRAHRSSEVEFLPEPNRPHFPSRPALRRHCPARGCISHWIIQGGLTRASFIGGLESQGNANLILCSILLSSIFSASLLASRCAISLTIYAKVHRQTLCPLSQSSSSVHPQTLSRQGITASSHPLHTPRQRVARPLITTASPLDPSEIPARPPASETTVET